VFHLDTRDTQLWDITNPRRPTVLSTLHSPSRTDIALRTTGLPASYSADGHLLAVTGDRTARLWNVTNRHQPTNDHVIAKLHRRLDTETDGDLARGMHYPMRWDPFFAST
jgi:hypothetical protein